jgi:hypothetical protein
MEQARAQKLLMSARMEIGSFALGWTDQCFVDRIRDIYLFVCFNNAVIPLARRRRIARLAADVLGTSGASEGGFHDVLSSLAEARRWQARQLQNEISGLGGLDGDFRRNLIGLAGDRANAKASGHGGDRRSGERTLKGSVLVMAVRLYCEAAEHPGFSINGPLVRFVGLIGELVLNQEKPFTPNAVKKAYQNMRGVARRLGSLRYSSFLK